MPRANVIQSNFTAGEISPRMRGRVDIERYQNAAELIENGLVLAHGGVQRRPGVRLVAEAKTGADPVRLLPFVFNTEQAYMIEAGPLYLRFYMDGAQILSGGVPVEVVTPYDAAALPEVDYVQSADTMFTAHVSAPMQRLRRFGHDAWVFDPIPFVTEPFAETGHRPQVGLTVDDPTPGVDRTFTTDGPAFYASDLKRTLEAMGGVAKITSYVSATSVKATITTAFPAAAFTAGQWLLAGTPHTTVTPSADGPVGASITLNGGNPTWRAEDVGSFVTINGGLVEITDAGLGGTVPGGSATGIVRQALTSTVSAGPFAWVLNGSTWNDADGYPRSLSFHEQRLWAAGSPNYPLTVWGSRLGEYLNFELGVLDDAAVSFDVVSDQLNPVRHVAQMKALVCFTYGAEFTLHGGVEKPITPTNVQVKNQSAFGCNKVAPVRVANELLFVNASGRKIRALSADRFDASNYNAPDLTILSEHITESGVVDATFQADPDPYYFAVRADGVLAACALDRDQDIVAWSRCTSAAAFEAVATIPTGSSEQTWVVMRLGTRRFVGYFDPSISTDLAVTATSAEGSAIWGGLEHLEGRTVDVIADGADMGQFVVDDGQVVLPRTAHEVEIGLNYVTRVKMLPPDFPTPVGTMHAAAARAFAVWVRVKDTIGAFVNGEELANRQFGEQRLDVPPTPITGLFQVGATGWDRGEMEVVIEQRRPMPFHLLAVVRRLEVGD